MIRERFDGMESAIPFSSRSFELKARVAFAAEGAGGRALLCEPGSGCSPHGRPFWARLELVLLGK